MKQWRSLSFWFSLGGIGAVMSHFLMAPGRVGAMPLATPTPAGTINQPYVTFQTPRLTQPWMQSNSNVPIVAVLIVLLILFILTAYYLRTIRRKG